MSVTQGFGDGGRKKPIGLKEKPEDIEDCIAILSFVRDHLEDVGHNHMGTHVISVMTYLSQMEKGGEQIEKREKKNTK